MRQFEQTRLRPAYRPPAAAAALTVALLLAACGGEGELDARASDPKAKPKREQLVELVELRVDTLRTSSVYTGSLRHRNAVRVFNQEEGRVVELPHHEGDSVAAGAVLLRLDDALLRAERAKSEAVLGEGRANLERFRRLRGNKLVAEEEYLRAATVVEVARAELALLDTRIGHTVVRAPFAGLVTARLAEVGDIVPRHTHVLTFADPISLGTELRVSELLTPHIAPGDAVGVRIDALGGEGFPARVLRVHPELDARTRQGTVEVALDPVPRGARAGQFARVSFTTRAFDRLVMPFMALRLDGEGAHVYRVDNALVAARTPVRTGRRLGQRIEVLEGLAAGDRVVARGFLGLRDGMVVTPVRSHGAPEEAR